ncbi:MAG: hypothetical protein ACYDIA_17335 [Candidatus Humimicrobiaceae bacterium]
MVKFVLRSIPVANFADLGSGDDSLKSLILFIQEGYNKLTFSKDWISEDIYKEIG